MATLRLRSEIFWMLALIAAVAAAYAIAVSWVGPVPTTRVPGDEAIWFDGAYRLFAGQRQHTDFYSPLGALYFQVPAWIMMLIGRSMEAFGYATASFAAVLAILTWLACRRRLPQPFVVTLVVLVLVFILSTRGYGGRFHELNFAGLYNEIGLVLILDVMVLAFCPRMGESGRDWSRLALIGIALAMAFSIKITHFLLISAVTVFAECLVHRRTLRAAMGACIAVAAISGIVIVTYGLATGVPLAGYLADLHLAAMAKVSGWDVFPWILYLHWTPEFLLYLLVLVVTAVLAMPGDDGEFRVRYGGFLLLGVAITAILPIIHSQPTEAFFPCALALVLSGLGWRRGALARAPAMLPSHHRWPLRASLYLFVATAGFLVVAPNVGAEIYGRAIPIPKFQGIDSLVEVPIAGAPPWRFYPRRSAPGEAAYVRAMVAALPDLVREGGRDAPIAVLDFSNPFPFLLGSPPQAGGAAWWHVGVNLSDRNARRLPSPISGACLVLYPHRPYDARTRDFLAAWVSEALTHDYAVAAETAEWRIWRLRAGCDGARGSRARAFKGL